MNPLAKTFVLVNRRDNVRIKVARKRSCKLDPLHCRSCDGAQQTAGRCCAFEAFQPSFGFGSIAVYVLTNQMDFLVPLFFFKQKTAYEICSSSARFAASRERHNAIGAKLVAALDD